MRASDETTFDVSLERSEDFRFTVDFGVEDGALLQVDEPPPLGEGDGPNAVRLLAAAVGNCLAASLLFCLRKVKAEPKELSATVTGTLARTHRGHLRVRELRVRLDVDGVPDAQSRMGRCLDIFEDYCTVTESVREGIEVLVEVHPKVPAGVGAGVSDAEVPAGTGGD